MNMKTILLFLCLVFSAVFARPTLIIIDASGSMEDYLPDGTMKIDAAKTAAKQIVQSANDEIALMTYDDCDYGGDPTYGPIRVVVNFTMNKQILIQQIDAIEPWGSTPIADSIKEGSKYVATTGQDAGIVLLTDGEETCGYLDSQEIADLAATSGVSIVNIVGFQLDNYTQAQMAEVAEATGGSYYDATDVASLTYSLQQAYGSASGSDLVCCSAPVAILLALSAFALSKR